MKEAENLVQGSITGVFNQSLPNSSCAPVFQGLMDGLGWKNPADEINTEEKLEAEHYFSFQEIEALYEQNPTEKNRQKLLDALDSEIAAAKTELRRIKI